MTNENILDAIGGINEKAVQDAKAYKRPKSKRWFRWGAIAACVCLMIPLTAFAVDIIQYKAELTTKTHFKILPPLNLMGNSMKLLKLQKFLKNMVYPLKSQKM